MKCFYDPSQDAIGVCKSCGRGLSSEFLADMGKGLACKNRCEKDVTDIITMIGCSVASINARAAIAQTTTEIMRRSSVAGYGSAVFVLITGVIFTGTGWQDSKAGFPWFFGLAFLAYGVWSLIRIRRYANLVAKLPGAIETKE